MSRKEAPPETGPESKAKARLNCGGHSAQRGLVAGIRSKVVMTVRVTGCVAPVPSTTRPSRSIWGAERLERGTPPRSGGRPQIVSNEPLGARIDARRVLSLLDRGGVRRSPVLVTHDADPERALGTRPSRSPRDPSLRRGPPTPRGPAFHFVAALDA